MLSNCAMAASSALEKPDKFRNASFVSWSDAFGRPRPGASGLSCRRDTRFARVVVRRG